MVKRLFSLLMSLLLFINTVALAQNTSLVEQNIKTVPTLSEGIDFVDEINNAESASKVKTIIESKSNWAFSADMNGIFYPMTVYAGLIGKNFSSFREFDSLYASLASIEKANPKVSLLFNNSRATEIKAGNYTVEVAPTVKKGIKIVAAAYSGNTLVAYDIKDSSDKEQTILSLNNISDTNTGFKVFFLENLETLKPFDAREVFWEDTVELYVSVKGTPEGDGSLDNPFDSVDSAREYIRTLTANQNSDIRVNIMDGTYYIGEPITFTEEDSGKNGYDIIYSSASNTVKATISGGVPVTGWKEHANGIYKAKVDDSIDEVRQFYVNGYGAHRAKSNKYYIAENGYTEDVGQSQTFELENYLKDQSFKRRETVASGGYVVGTKEGSNPNIKDIEITVDESGYYDIVCKVNKSSSGSYSNINFYLDGVKIGSNTGTGTALDGYTYGSMPVYKYTNNGFLLEKGKHSLTAAIDKVKGTNHYSFVMDSIELVPSQAECGFYTSGYDLPVFTNQDDIELVYMIYWAQQRLPVKSITSIPSEDRHLFKMDFPSYAAYTSIGSDIEPNRGTLFYIENAIELLDEPGEFYFDKSSGYIYYYPEDESFMNYECYVPKSEGLINILGTSKNSKVSNIRFENLSFKHGAWNEVSKNGLCTYQADCICEYDKSSSKPNTTGNTLNAQIHIEYADGIKLTDCEFANLASSAVSMTEAVTNSSVTNSTVHDISGTAFAIGSWRYNTASDEGTLSSNIDVINNYIRRIGQEFMGCPAIGLYHAKYIDVLHNDILDTPYTGITLGWGWGDSIPDELLTGGHNIAYNRVESAVKALIDGGAIYTLGDYGIHTNIYENYLIDSSGLAAIYLDSGSENLSIERNVIEGSEKFWVSGEPRYDSVICDNYVDSDVNRLTIRSGADNSGRQYNIIYGVATVYEGALWADEPYHIAGHAGIQKSLRDDITCTDLPQGMKTVYDLIPCEESVSENDILVEAEDYTSDGIQPKTAVQAKQRTTVMDFAKENACYYNITVPRDGNYRVEIRYATGMGATPDWKNNASIVVYYPNNVFTGQQLWNENQYYGGNSDLTDTLMPFTAAPSKRLGELALSEGNFKLKVQNRGGGGWSFDNIKLIFIGE